MEDRSLEEKLREEIRAFQRHTQGYLDAKMGHSATENLYANFSREWDIRFRDERKAGRDPDQCERLETGLKQAVTDIREGKEADLTFTATHLYDREVSDREPEPDRRGALLAAARAVLEATRVPTKEIDLEF